MAPCLTDPQRGLGRLDLSLPWWKTNRPGCQAPEKHAFTNRAASERLDELGPAPRAQPPIEPPVVQLALNAPDDNVVEARDAHGIVRVDHSDRSQKDAHRVVEHRAWIYRLVALRTVARLGLNGRQAVGLLRALKHGRMTLPEYGGMHPGVSRRTLQRDVAELIAKGVLLPVGATKNRVYRPSP